MCDLRPARLKVSARDALERARRVAERMPGWTITMTDADGGAIEASPHAPVRFKDDIAIRVRPDGAAESPHRHALEVAAGARDIGTNANRIRTFISRVEAATAAELRSGDSDASRASLAAPIDDAVALSRSHRRLVVSL